MKNSYQIFVNGTIYIDEKRKVENIAVKNGRVCALNVDPNQFKKAEIIDLKGNTAYPGFHDSHVHSVEAGFALSGANLENCKNSKEIADTIAEVVKKMPKGAPLIGEGFSLDNYKAWSLNDLATIDQVTGSRPIILMDNLGHNCVVNSESLKISNITAETTPPMGGQIIVEDEKPTGMLRESAMELAAKNIIPLFAEEIFRNGALKYFTKWAVAGYTSVVDLMGAPLGRILKPEICMELEKEGLLPVRVNYMYTFFSLDEIEGAMQYVGKDTEMVRFGGLKIFIDGAYAGGEAWTSWKNAEGGHGLWYVSTDDRQSKEYNINRIVEKVNDLGLNIHYHVQGDKAISAVLDAIENAKKNKGFLTSTHTLIHLAFPTDKQIAHMKRLAPHVVATVQPAFWQVEKDSVKYYGARAKFCYPIKKLIKAGISTGMSTDFSVSPLKLSAPTKVMNIALTGAGDPFHHKPLDLEAVIKGFTRASAATSPRRDIGTLEVGRMADMVVYDQDLYSVPKDEFNEDNPKVISTWIGGRKVRKLLD